MRGSSVTALTQQDWEKLERIWYRLGSWEFWEVAFSNRKKPDLFLNSCRANHLYCRSMKLNSETRKP